MGTAGVLIGTPDLPSEKRGRCVHRRTNSSLPPLRFYLSPPPVFRLPIHTDYPGAPNFAYVSGAGTATKGLGRRRHRHCCGIGTIAVTGPGWSGTVQDPQQLLDDSIPRDLRKPPCSHPAAVTTSPAAPHVAFAHTNLAFREIGVDLKIGMTIRTRATDDIAL